MRAPCNGSARQDHCGSGDACGREDGNGMALPLGAWRSGNAGGREDDDADGSQDHWGRKRVTMPREERIVMAMAARKRWNTRTIAVATKAEQPNQGRVDYCGASGGRLQFVTGGSYLRQEEVHNSWEDNGDVEVATAGDR